MSPQARAAGCLPVVSSMGAWPSGSHGKEGTIVQAHATDCFQLQRVAHAPNGSRQNANIPRALLVAEQLVRAPGVKDGTRAHP